MAVRLLIGLFCGALVALSSPAPAVASGHLPFEPSPPTPIPCVGSHDMIATAILLPSEVGVFIPDRDPEFMFAWSWQFPLSPGCHSRLTTEIEVLPTAPGPVRGRVGYRYGTRYFLAGLGGTFSSAGYTWSPEAAVQFAHLHYEDLGAKPNDVSFHLLIRAELAPAFDHLSGVTLLLGWNMM